MTPEPNYEPDYIVLRPEPGLKVSKYYDGYWYDKSQIPVRLNTLDTLHYTAQPTGKFEVRDDGAIAEIWEVKIPNEHKSN